MVISKELGIHIHTNAWISRPCTRWRYIIHIQHVISQTPAMIKIWEGEKGWERNYREEGKRLKKFEERKTREDHYEAAAAAFFPSG